MLFTAIVFLVLLSVLVFVHEFGHFLLAKKAGIKVEEFGLGLPPRIWGKKIGETIYSVNALPIGGFVRLWGEEVGSERWEVTETEVRGGKWERAFFTKSKRVRIGVVVAGVLMNFLLAVGAFSLIFLIRGIPTKTENIQVVGIAKDSPAQEAGLAVGDKIIQAAGQSVLSTDEFIKIVDENKGKEIEIVLERQSEKNTSDGGRVERSETSDSSEVEELRLKVIPREAPPEGEGPLGVAISQIEQKFYPFYQMPFFALREGMEETLSWGGMVIGAVGKMVVELVGKGRIPQEMAGPVGIFQVTGVVAKEGWGAVLEFLGILSVNLAVINILPFPPLDGGKVLFIGLEAAFGKRVAPKMEKWVQTLGMILLLLLLVLVTLNDISRLITQRVF